MKINKNIKDIPNIPQLQTQFVLLVFSTLINETMSFSKPIADFEPTDEMSTDSQCSQNVSPDYAIPAVRENLQSEMSVYIPYVKLSVTREQIAVSFCRNNIGLVKRVDLVRKEEEQRTYFQAFVHFEMWYDNTVANNIRNKLLQGHQARMVYDDPCYWNLHMNHSWNRDVFHDTVDETTRLRNLISTMNQEHTRLVDDKEKLLQYREKIITRQYQEIENLVKTVYTRTHGIARPSLINEMAQQHYSMIRRMIQQECQEQMTTNSNPETDASISDLCNGVENYKIDDDTAQVCPTTPPSTRKVPTTPPPAPKRARHERMLFTQDMCDNA